VRLSYGSRTAVLPVIDRGPYGRIGAEWDLTAGAASALGVTETVRVGARVVGSTPNTATLGVPAEALGANSLAGGAVAG
jgi:rare lipoprotein A (peptidoglycan hydrolase)